MALDRYKSLIWSTLSDIGRGIGGFIGSIINILGSHVVGVFMLASLVYSFGMLIITWIGGRMFGMGKEEAIKWMKEQVNPVKTFITGPLKSVMDHAVTLFLAGAGSGGGGGGGNTTAALMTAIYEFFMI